MQARLETSSADEVGPLSVNNFSILLMRSHSRLSAFHITPTVRTHTRSRPVKRPERAVSKRSAWNNAFIFLALTSRSWAGVPRSSCAICIRKLQAAPSGCFPSRRKRCGQDCSGATTRRSKADAFSMICARASCSTNSTSQSASARLPGAGNFNHCCRPCPCCATPMSMEPRLDSTRPVQDCPKTAQADG